MNDKSSYLLKGLQVMPGCSGKQYHKRICDRNSYNNFKAGMSLLKIHNSFYFPIRSTSQLHFEINRSIVNMRSALHINHLQSGPVTLLSNSVLPEEGPFGQKQVINKSPKYVVKTLRCDSFFIFVIRSPLYRGCYFQCICFYARNSVTDSKM